MREPRGPAPPAGRERAVHLDENEPLTRLRERFVLPRSPEGRPLVYLSGNSLGLAPRRARAEVEAVLDDWERLAVRGHFQAGIPWYSYHQALAGPLARLVGAQPDEVVAMNSLTANLHLMLTSFYRPTPSRHRIVMEAQAFSSDRYAAESQIRLHGLEPRTSLLLLEPRPGEDTLRDDDMEQALRQENDSIALILLGGVQYLTGQVFDLERVCRVGREIGAVVGLDLAHAVGNVSLRLHEWEADFAVWCGYKYLNGGPGAPGGCFVHQRHGRDRSLPRLAGWWGTDPATRFRMDPTFRPQVGAAGWQLSNPLVLGLAALKASLDLFQEVGMEALRSRSERLTGFLQEQLTVEAGVPFRVLTPAEPARRGCQISVAVDRAQERVRELETRGFICDARPPDILRVAPTPLYNTFQDVWSFSQAFKNVPGAP
ncbi:MAG: kynureninase [Acidobacteriota bacterium]